MTDEHNIPPFAPEETAGSVSDTLKGAAERVSGAIEAGRKPGMPNPLAARLAKAMSDRALPKAQ